MYISGYFVNAKSFWRDPSETNKIGISGKIMNTALGFATNNTKAITVRLPRSLSRIRGAAAANDTVSETHRSL